MLNRFNNIEESDNSVKNLIIILSVALIIIGMSVYLFLAPPIIVYSELQKENKKQLVLIGKRIVTYKSLDEEVKKIQYENEQVIEAFNHVFNQNDFLEFCDRFFKDTVLKKIEVGDVYSGEYMTYEFQTTMRVSSPQNFYDFLDEIGEYKNIIQIEYPIKMEGVGEYIKISFMIKVYELYEKRDREVTKRDLRAEDM